MSYKDISIKCRGYWMGGNLLTKEEKSFFNPNLNPSYYTEELELTDFLTNDTELSFNYEFEDIDLENASLKLFSTCGAVSLKLSNVKPIRTGFYLFNYFGFDNPPYSTEIKFKVIIYYQSKKIFQGVLDSSSLVFSNPNELVSREVISLQIYSWEKEFKDYFNSQKLPDGNVFNWQTITGAAGNNETYLDSLCDKIFGANIVKAFDSGINNNEPIKDWMISRIPYLTVAPDSSNANSRIWTVYNGYDYIRNNLKTSCFDFWKKLCNAMGWVFYFGFADRINSNDITLITRNRVTSPAFSQSLSFNNVLTFDVSSLIEYNVIVSPYTQIVKTIKLSVFQAFGGNEAFFDDNKLQGEHDLFFTNSSQALKTNFHHFEKLYVEGGGAYPEASPTYTHLKTVSTDGEYTYAKEIYYNGNIANNYYYKNEFLMELDGGHNKYFLEQKRRMNFADRTPTDYHSGDNISAKDYIYCGNIGMAMIRNERNGDFTQYCTTLAGSDHKYINTVQFKNNINALITDKQNTVVEVTVSGFYPYPLKTIKFTDIAGPLNYVFQGSFEILNLEADAINETTKFKLRRNG